MIVPDANVFIAYFQKKEPTRSLLDNNISKQKIIFSVVSIAEFLVKALPEEKDIMEGFLRDFGCISVDEKIMEQAVLYRQQALQKSKRSHLLDCFIAATAKVHQAILLTFDRRDYPFRDISVKQPEELKA